MKIEGFRQEPIISFFSLIIIHSVAERSGDASVPTADDTKGYDPGPFEAKAFIYKQYIAQLIN